MGGWCSVRTMVLMSMQSFRLEIDNLRALRTFRWSPQGLSALVGPNGTGKSTALLALKFLAAAWRRGVVSAMSSVLGGINRLRSDGASADESVWLRLAAGDVVWSIELGTEGRAVPIIARESLQIGDRMLFDRVGLSGFRLLDSPEGSPLLGPSNENLGLWILHDRGEGGEPVSRMAELVRGIAVYHDLDLYRIRTEGSSVNATERLESRGHNAIAMLRAWYLQRPDRWRYDLVVSALRAAFPRLVEDIDFDEAGTTVVARIYRPKGENPVLLAYESNGLICMLVSMCALVSAPEGGVVAIDEAGEALHPFALGVLLRQADQLARRRRLTVVVTSHNPAVLDFFQGALEQVWVMTGQSDNAVTPITEYRNAEWLAQFRLGELYADSAIGSNEQQAS